jgi:hypothetical protein
MQRTPLLYELPPLPFRRALDCPENLMFHDLFEYHGCYDSPDAIFSAKQESD